MTSGARAPSLKGRALRYLAAREHSRAELQAKLARHVTYEDEPGALTRVLDELAAKGFINEARVAESLLHRRAGRLGQARVLQELRAKGLPDEIMADAADQLRTTELARALARPGVVLPWWPTKCANWRKKPPTPPPRCARPLAAYKAAPIPLPHRWMPPWSA